MHHKMKQIQSFRKKITGNFLSFDKIMKIWNPKRYHHVFKTCIRQKTTPKRYQKLEFQTLGDKNPPGKTLNSSFISRASTFLVHVFMCVINFFHNISNLTADFEYSNSLQYNYGKEATMESRPWC